MEYSKFADNVKKIDCSVIKIDIAYNQSDSRCWSALLNQNKDNIVVTHHLNKYDYGTQTFDIFSSDKIITDVETEDLYDTLDLLIKREQVQENSTQE
jgi:hypothetical protein